MPTAAKAAQQFTNVNLCHPAAGHQVNPIPHGHHQYQQIQVFHVPHHVSQTGNISHIPGTDGMGH